MGAVGGRVGAGYRCYESLISFNATFTFYPINLLQVIQFNLNTSLPSYTFVLRSHPPVK